MNKKSPEPQHSHENAPEPGFYVSSAKELSSGSIAYGIAAENTD